MTDLEKVKQLFDELGITYHVLNDDPRSTSSKYLQLDSGPFVGTDDGNIGCDFHFNPRGSFEKVFLYEN